MKLVRISDRAVDEAAQILALSRRETQQVLSTWIEQVQQTQTGNRAENGLLRFRGPKPLRLIMLLTEDDRGPGLSMVSVVRPPNGKQRDEK